MADGNTNIQPNPEQQDQLKSAQRTLWRSMEINPGYVVAGISTALLSVMSISRNEHKILRELKVNSPIYDAATEVAQEHFAATGESAQQIKDRLKPLFKDTLQNKGLNNLMKLADKQAAKNLETHGIENNMFSAWNKVLKRHHKVDVILKLATVASFAIGAIYSFSRERHLAESERHLTEKLHSQIVQNGSRLQRQLAQDTGSISQQIENERQQQSQQGQSR